MRLLSALLAALPLLSMSPAIAASAQNPAVVELFTSQGCSSCPPANDNLRALAGRTDVLALSFAVTYWDYLGWKDTFGQPAFTQRQSDYERPLGQSGSFTPQMVIDGRYSSVGINRSEVEALIAKSNRANAPALALSGNSVSIAAGEGKADVLLVRYDPGIEQVPVSRGENAGVTLPHKNVVRSLIRLGEWDGKPAQFTLPSAPAGLKTAILLQRGPGGPILTAARD